GRQAVLACPLRHLLPLAPSFRAELAGAVPRADHSDPVVEEDTVALRVIPVVVRVERVSDWLARCLSDLGQDGLDSPRRVRLDDDHEIAELDPAGVGRLLCVFVTLTGVDAGRKLPNFPARLSDR